MALTECTGEQVIVNPPADPKRYSPDEVKTLASLYDTAMEEIGYTEQSGFTAEKSYAVGEYIKIDGMYYIAIAPISEGESMVIGENISEATAEDILGDLGGGSGDGEIPLDGVNFIDYDGSLVQHYTAEEFSTLTALPANPSHEGLVSQGWNWSLEDAKNYVAYTGSLNIGESYITDDGKTRVYIEIPEEAAVAGRSFQVKISSSAVGNTKIDWGDGSSQYNTTTSSLAYRHDYDSPGEYLITVNAESGHFGIDSFLYISESVKSYLKNYVKKVEFGNGLTAISSFALRENYKLETVTIPNGITNIGMYAFSGCGMLKSIVLPASVNNASTYIAEACRRMRVVSVNKTFYCADYDFRNCSSLQMFHFPPGRTDTGNYVFNASSSLLRVYLPSTITSIGASCFVNGYSLLDVNIPEGVTVINNEAFNHCYAYDGFELPNSLTTIGNSAFYQVYASKLILPASVTSIGTNAFSGASMLEIHVKATTPPSIQSNSFGSLNSNCVIYVPAGTLATYQSATNWSAYATMMREE